MLEIHTFGPYFGLPDGSPFCIKALTLMKMSGLPFEVKKMSFKKAPKGKAPYLNDNGKIIADSFFIQRHLEKAHGVDFTSGYSKEELARGWAMERMVEDHLYFIMGNIRWDRDENFWKGPYQFFSDAPAPIRPLIARLVRRGRAKGAKAQGLARHTAEEQFELAKGDVDAIETELGNKPFMLGGRPSGVDASVLGGLWAAECPYLKSELGDYIRSRPKLMDYLRRMQQNYFPEFKV